MGWLTLMGTLGMNASPGWRDAFSSGEAAAAPSRFMCLCAGALLSQCCATARRETSHHTEL